MKVVKIYFKNSNEICFIECLNNKIKKGDFVIVESEKYINYGEIIDVLEVNNIKYVNKNLNILRIATEDDKKINKKNNTDSDAALKKAKSLHKQLNLKMKLINAYFTFDRKQLIINFTADDRIDFREFAKKLAALYKTRIELRQIGVRDKAKEIGGIGPCGRFLCCNLFLNDFESVSINMAKNQYISLKPDKINGICGRLLCCLNYEDEQYKEMKKKYPKIGEKVKVKNIEGKILSLNIFKQTVTIEKSDKSIITMDINDYESSK